MRWLAVLGAVLAWIQSAGCRRAPASEQTGGRVSAAWIGSDTGRFGATARAEWCDSLRVLEIRVLHGDSGLALALYPVDSVRPDSYGVRPPDLAASNPPSAAVALRWFAETAIRGFRGDSGAVVLERAGHLVSGRFHSAMHSVGEDRRIDLTGSFHDLPVVPATRGCVSRRPVEPADSGVD